jgi:hypothetical protein
MFQRTRSAAATCVADDADSSVDKMTAGRNPRRKAMLIS